MLHLQSTQTTTRVATWALSSQISQILNPPKERYKSRGAGAEIAVCSKTQNVNTHTLKCVGKQPKRKHKHAKNNPHSHAMQSNAMQTAGESPTRTRNKSG